MMPPGKTFATLDTGRLPGPVVQQLETLATGAFLETATNVLAFGLPGVGKSHALSAVGHALVEASHTACCAPRPTPRSRSFSAFHRQHPAHLSAPTAPARPVSLRNRVECRSKAARMEGHRCSDSPPSGAPHSWFASSSS